MDSVVQEIANVGFTLLVLVIGFIIVKWLDNNIFNKRDK